jgi:hypothetical protein
MVTAGRRRPFLDFNARGRNANHNIGRRGAEGQRAYKNQSDQSLKNHNTLSFFSTKLRTNPAKGLRPSSSPSEGVIENQLDYVFTTL